MSALWEQIKSAKEAANKLATDMGKMASEKRGIFTPEEQEKFNTMSKDLDGHKKSLEVLNAAYDAGKSVEHKDAPEVRSMIGRENGSEMPQLAEGEHEKRSKLAFSSYLRNGLGDMSPELRSFIRTDAEARSLTAGGIGVVGDRAFYNGLFEALKNYSGPLDAGAFVFNRTDGNPFTVMAVNDTSNKASKVSEGSDTFSGTYNGFSPAPQEYADPNSQDPVFTPVTYQPKKYSSKWIQLSLELLQDNAFDAEGYIYRAASTRIGRQLNSDITATALTATVGSTTAANNAITYTDWVNFTGSLNWAYRKNKAKVKIELADTTLAKLRGIVDSQNRPIFLNVTNPQEGVTEVLDGFGYVINDDIPAFGASNVIGLIADHEQAFGLASVVNPTVVRADQLFMQNGMIGFIVFSRYDFAIINGPAVRTWQVHA